MVSGGCMADHDHDYDDVEEDFYDEEEDFDDTDYEDDEEEEYEEDDEETFEPDNEVGGDGDVSIEQYDPPLIPELLTDISGYIGNVSIMETGMARVDVDLDFMDIPGITTYEVRVTPL
jgi:hypothetical protein